MVIFNRQVKLTLFAIATMLELHGFGDLHHMLHNPTGWRWYPSATRKALAEKAWDEVKAAGLVDRRGRLDIDFLDILPLLHAGSLEYYAAIKTGDRIRTVLISSSRAGAILVESDGETATITGIRNENLPETLIRTLPNCGPGGGSAINIPVDEILADTQPRQRTGYTEDVFAGTPSNALLLYRQLISLPRRAEGELYVAVVHEGRRAESHPPLKFVDTSKGRWCLRHTRTRGGPEHIVSAPATTHELVTSLHTMRQGLGR